MLPPALTLSAQRLLESDSHCKVFPTAELHPKVKSPHAAFGLWPSVSCTPTMFSPSHSAIHHYFLKCCHISPKCSCLTHTYGSSSQRSRYQKSVPWQCLQNNLWVDWLDILLVHWANTFYFQSFLSGAKCEHVLSYEPNFFQQLTDLKGRVLLSCATWDFYVLNSSLVGLFVFSNVA